MRGVKFGVSVQEEGMTKDSSEEFIPEFFVIDQILTELSVTSSRPPVHLNTQSRAEERRVRIIFSTSNNSLTW